jgi:hypothetical protein
MILLRLAPDKQMSLIKGIQFRSENAIKIMQTIGKYLAITYESSAC